MKSTLHIFLLAMFIMAFSSCESSEPAKTGSPSELEETGMMDYAHKVLALQFTSVGCTGCPAMSEAVQAVQSENSGVLIPLAFHMDYGQTDDPMDVSVASLFQKIYDFSSLPHLIFNFRKSTSDIQADKFSVAAALRTILEESAECGVALVTEFDETSRQLKINMSVATNIDERYRYHIFLVEDGVSGIQFGAENSQNYTHDNVVRKMLSSDIYGDNLNGRQPIPAGYAAKVSERVVIEQSWNVSNMRVVAVAMVSPDGGDTWICANANECQVGAGCDYLSRESSFRKNIAVWEFTGAWCAFCPDGYNNMNFVISRNEEFLGRVYIMAFHSDAEGNDPMALTVTDQIRTECGVTFGYPSYLLEMRVSGPLTGDTYELKDSFRQELSKTDLLNPPHCGVAVSSSLTDGMASVEVKLHSEMTGTYRIAVFLVEDAVVSPQNVSSVVVGDYVHNHVVRSVVSSSYRGDRLGVVEAGEEVVKTFSASVPAQCNIENTYVYALAVNADGVVNNMNVCKMDGGNATYPLK